MDIPLTVDRGDAVVHEPCKLGMVEEYASNHEENSITGKRQISRNAESQHLVMWLRICTSDTFLLFQSSGALCMFG